MLTILLSIYVLGFILSLLAFSIYIYEHDDMKDSWKICFCLFSWIFIVYEMKEINKFIKSADTIKK